MNLNSKLVLTTDKETLEFSNDKDFSQKFDYEQVLNSSNGFVTMSEFDPASKGQVKLENPRLICIYNPSNQPAEIRLTYQGITAGSTDATGVAVGVISKIL